MRILVIPDVHLKYWMFDKINEVPKDKYDNIICLGDIVDDWDQYHNVDLYINTMEKVLEFDKEHPEMLWCWGNHDYSYLYCFTESGYSKEMVPTVNKYLIKMIDQFGDRFKVLHQIDTVIFSHAGLTESYIYDYFGENFNNLSEIINTINSYALNKETAYDLWEDDSPLWARPDKWVTYIPYFQVVGHSPVSVVTQKNKLVLTDVFSTFSNGEPIGNSKFIIVNTTAKTWEYVC